MKRLRIVFVLLALCLWLPLLGFALFSLRTVRADEDARYQAVGERVFDEMERELNVMLAREEARPASEYDFARGPGPVARHTPFIVGYFVRNGSGELRHSSFTGDAERIQKLVAEKTALPLAVASLAPQALQQAAGSTLEVSPKSAPSKRYDPLSSLNRGAWTRGVGSMSSDVAESDERSGRASPAAPLRRSASQPLRALAGDAEHVILARQVERDGQPVTQGFVVTLPEMRAWLAERVLNGAGLGASARLAELGSEPPLGADEHRYQHRFAEPFAMQTAVLTLGVIEELEAGFTYYALSGLLLLLGALALFAGYRMAAAVVGFAERRNNFVSAVTHELKTPLTSIRMYGEMLRDGVVADSDKRDRYYRIITAESERLSRLIDNVLELARLERNQRAMSLSLGDVTGVVRETLEVLEPHAAELAFELRFEAAPDLPAVAFDRDALSQVLFNLVDNALKYSSEATDRFVSIRCERQGQGVVLRVADRGPGVAPEQQRLIWQPFYRGERELTRKHKGTGIGLSLVRGLVQRMGGSVTSRNTNPGFEVSIALGPA
jgi:signal transduction histidine kinase